MKKKWVQWCDWNKEESVKLGHLFSLWFSIINECRKCAVKSLRIGIDTGWHLRKNNIRLQVRENHPNSSNDFQVAIVICNPRMKSATHFTVLPVGISISWIFHMALLPKSEVKFERSIVQCYKATQNRNKTIIINYSLAIYRPIQYIDISRAKIYNFEAFI